MTDFRITWLSSVLRRECKTIISTIEVQVPMQDGTGSRWDAGARTPGANFVDADGDGVCDNCLNGGTHPQDGTGLQMGRGGRWNR
jgi:hypothetical protein